MLRRAFPRTRLGVWLFTVAAALLAPTTACAQQDAFGFQKELEQSRVKFRDRFEQLLTGAEQPEPADKEKMDAFARLYVYRMLEPNLMGINSSDRSRYPQLVEELDRQIKTHAIPNAAKNQEFMKQWTERMILAFNESFGKILPNAAKNRIAIVGVSLLLPVYAKTKQEKFAEYLQGLITDEKIHDVVRLYAVKALQQYGPARAHMVSDGDLKDEPELAKVIARDTKRVEALLRFLNRKWDGVDPAAAQFIRREALRTLAETRVPAMDVLKGGKVVAPAAYTLLRVLAPTKDGPNPPPSLSEKYEAALGVARMNAKHIEAYQPQPGLYLLGKFLVEFVEEYLKDYANFGGKNIVVGAKKKKGDRKIAAQPWKAMAKRLSEALPKLEQGLRDNDPSFAKAKQLVATAQGFLSKIQNHQAISDNPTVLLRAANALMPSDGTLFKGNKDYQVQVAPAGD